MKKCGILLLLMLLLSGCSGAEPMETVSDELLIAVMADPVEVVLELPESATQQVMTGEGSDRLYFCDGYSLSVQTLQGGDLERSLRSLCGYSSENLTLMKTACDGIKRFDWVWVSAGEGGDQLGRAALLDDGSHHYCVSVMADATASANLDEEWEAIFSSISLTDQSS